MAAVTVKLVTTSTVTFNSATTGTQWKCYDVEGWDGPDVTHSLFEITGDMGQITGESKYSGRPLLLRGNFRATSQTNAWTARALLNNASKPHVEGTLTVSAPGSSHYATIRQAGPLRIRHVNSYTCDFQLPLHAADPRKYTVAATTTTLS